MPPLVDDLEEGPRRKAEDARGVCPEQKTKLFYSAFARVGIVPYDRHSSTLACSKREAGDADQKVETPAAGFTWHYRFTMVRTAVHPRWFGLPIQGSHRCSAVKPTTKPMTPGSSPLRLDIDAHSTQFRSPAAGFSPAFAMTYIASLYRAAFSCPWCSPRNTLLVTAANGFSRTWVIPGWSDA